MSLCRGRMPHFDQNMSWCNIAAMEVPAVQINDCGIADYPSGGRLGPRTLPDYEIIWIERGECRWEFDDKQEICRPGSVLLCPPGMVDTWYWDPAETTRHGFLHFDFVAPIKGRLPLRRTCTGSDVLRPLLRHAVWLASLGDSESEALAAESLRQALTWFVTGLVTQSGLRTRVELHPVILRALRALRNRWGNGPKTPPSIADWAHDTGVSRGHLARVCRQELDVTPQELLRYLRLDHALVWIGRTNMKFSEISENCGFQSQFHFSRCFKQTYGVSPREMRQQLLAGGDRPLSKVIGLRRMIQIVG